MNNPLNLLIFLCFFIKITALHVFHSLPFTTFSHKCPVNNAIIELSMRMYEKDSKKDIMFSVSCGEIEKMFPSKNYHRRYKRQNSPNEVCQWSAQKFDPLVDTTVQDTCSGGQYMAGLSRADQHSIEFLCCHLSERELEECRPFIYPLPTSGSPVVHLYLENNILVSIKQENELMTAIFCKLMAKQQIRVKRANQIPLLTINFGGAQSADIVSSPVEEEFLDLVASLLEAGKDDAAERLLNAQEEFRDTTTTLTTTRDSFKEQILAAFSGKNSAVERLFGAQEQITVPSTTTVRPITGDSLAQILAVLRNQQLESAIGNPPVTTPPKQEPSKTDNSFLRLIQSALEDKAISFTEPTTVRTTTSTETQQDDAAWLSTILETLLDGNEELEPQHYLPSPTRAQHTTTEVPFIGQILSFLNNQQKNAVEKTFTQNKESDISRLILRALDGSNESEDQIPLVQSKTPFNNSSLNNAALDALRTEPEDDKTGCFSPRTSAPNRDNLAFCRCFSQIIMRPKNCSTDFDKTLLNCLNLLNVFQRFSLETT